MKKTLSILSAAFVLAISACGDGGKGTVADSTHPLDTTKLSKGTTFYQCSMDPEITSDKAGSCPKCGMDLSKMEKK